MTKFRKIAVALAALLALGSAVPAAAGEYRINADSTQMVAFYACGSFYLSAEGDGDTDLDFRLYNPSGRLVHSDHDLTDITYARINSGCGMFHLYVDNLGRVFNMLDVTVRN